MVLGANDVFGHLHGLFFHHAGPDARSDGGNRLAGFCAGAQHAFHRKCQANTFCGAAHGLPFMSVAGMTPVPPFCERAGCLWPQNETLNCHLWHESCQYRPGPLRSHYQPSILGTTRGLISCSNGMVIAPPLYLAGM